LSESIKDRMSAVFMALYQDEELLQLLEVPSRNMKDIKTQIIEDRYPNDLVNDNLTRLCVFENSTSPSYNPNVEMCWVEVDVYTTKEKNKIDRRMLLVAEKVIDVLDARRRELKGLPPVHAGVDLRYFQRIPNMYKDNQEWSKYGLVFKYNNFQLL
jgi:hypothetical protein